MKHLCLVAAVAFLLSSATVAAQNTQRFTANKTNEYGLVYSLPVTVLDITVETECTSKRPGEFSNYANRHLGLTDVVRDESDVFTIKSITIGTHGIPNIAEQWQVQFKSGSTVSMTLTDGGLPLTINNAQVVTPKQPVLPQAVPAPVSPLQTNAARQAITLEMTRSTSPAKKAELAAQRIFELREQRNELISGNADNMPADGGALKVALQNLDEQEAALTAMFAGTSQTSTTVQTFQYTPTSGAVTDTIMARVSPIDGLVSADDLTGQPLKLSVEVLSQGKLPVNEKGEVKKFPKGGVAYTIPGSARIALSLNGKILAQTTVELAQLGCVFGLDPAIFSDKKAPMSAAFSPVTGAIVSLEAAR